jgi:restriction system protein
MPTMWGVRNNQPQLDFVDNGFIAIGWDELGDLSVIGDDKQKMQTLVSQKVSNIKPGAIPHAAGVLLKFAFRMQVGDFVVCPHKPDSTLNFGRIKGNYYYEGAAGLHRNRRSVEWLKTGIPRTTFIPAARNEVGFAMTLFEVKRHADLFRDFIGGATTPTPASVAAADPEQAAEAAAEVPNADSIETDSRDFIIETLMTQLEGVEFEHFVAHLLEAMGYRARVTDASGDGGFDIVAHRDPLGVEAPIIKVQCKRTTASQGGPQVQQLTGTLSPGGEERGLFVTLGAYSKDAQHLERTRQDLRLINGNELVDLIWENYEKFSPRYKQLLPMRSVYVVDRRPDAS